VQVAFEDAPAFFNANTVQELAQLQSVANPVGVPGPARRTSGE
jgi:hypothetical protein